MTYVVAIDPGAERCGIALFVDGRCVRVATLTPERLIEELEGVKADRVERVVVEGFRLFPWRAEAKSWSGLEEVETLGVVKYICRVRGWPVTEQFSKVLKIARGLVRSKGIELVSRQRDARSAELHGYYWLMKEGRLSANGQARNR